MSSSELLPFSSNKPSPQSGKYLTVIIVRYLPDCAEGLLLENGNNTDDNISVITISLRIPAILLCFNLCVLLQNRMWW